MPAMSYKRHQFHPSIIQHTVWLYPRFTLSQDSVEDLLSKRAVEVSYETIHRYVLEFGPETTRRLRRFGHTPRSRWHLDDKAIRISGKRRYVWRAVDDEGEVLAGC